MNEEAKEVKFVESCILYVGLLRCASLVFDKRSHQCTTMRSKAHAIYIQYTDMHWQEVKWSGWKIRNKILRNNAEKPKYFSALAYFFTTTKSKTNMTRVEIVCLGCLVLLYRVMLLCDVNGWMIVFPHSFVGTTWSVDALLKLNTYFP